MIRFRVFLGTALVLSAIVATFVKAELTDEQKKKRAARIKAGEELQTAASPTPAETTEPAAKQKPAKRKARKRPVAKPKGTATPAARKSPSPEPDESPLPKNKAKSGTKKSNEEDNESAAKPKRIAPTESGESPEPTVTPAAKKSPTPGLEESPAPKSKAKSGIKKPGAKDKEATARLKKKKARSKESARPKKKPGPKKMPAPQPEESTASKAQSKSGTKKSSEEGEAAASKQKQTKKPESGEAPEPAKKPGAKKSPTPEPSGSPTPKSGAKEETNAKKEATSKRIEKVEPAKTPPPVEKPPKTFPEPTGTTAPEQPARPSPQSILPSDITVEKSGLEKEQGLEPPPPPPRRGFWLWSRQPVNYHYLTSATIEAIRTAPVQRGRWKFIIVHNSGTRQGNARAFDYYHRKIRRMRNGLAYHFVIGNGTSSRNGQIEIGDRWRRQINGGHVHSDYLNNIALGICLVGDFNREQPTRAQLDACEELIRYLQERCGKSDGRSLMVRPHREVNPPRWATDCPGDVFPYGWFGRFR